MRWSKSHFTKISIPVVQRGLMVRKVSFWACLICSSRFL